MDLHGLIAVLAGDPFQSIAVLVILLCIAVWFTKRNEEISGIPNRSVLVTGCDTGFGNLLARSLDARGVRVFAGCLTTDGCKLLQDETSQRMTTFTIDISNRDSVSKALEFVKRCLNGEGLWGLVNNAGVMLSFAPVEWTSMDEYESVSSVNLFGTIAVTKAFLPLVRKSKGRILNVCSVASTFAIVGTSAYTVSKSALKLFTDCLRRELVRTGVTVHGVEPGGFQTSISQSQRIMHLFKKAYMEADPETIDVYGGHIASFFLTQIQSLKMYLSKDVHKVPDAMMHALFAKYPKRRYSVGIDANIVYPLLNMLPVWITDPLIGFPRPYGPKSSLLTGNDTVEHT